MTGRTTIFERRLPALTPFDHRWLQRFFAERAIAGVEAADGGEFLRAQRLTHGPALLRLRLEAGGAELHAQLSDPRDADEAVNVVVRLCDLELDPAAVADVLAADPLLAESLRLRPGLRLPGAADADELALRAVLGQQVSVAAAATAAARLAERAGEPVDFAADGVLRLFPTTAAVAELDPQSLPMPQARARALVGLAAALDSGEVVLDGSQPTQAVHEQLVALPGIGPWTASYIAMRALHDHDAFIAADLGVRRGLEALGLDGSPRAALERAERWRPFRACAVMHLWAAASANIAA